jgi:TPR repeat protein
MVAALLALAPLTGGAGVRAKLNDYDRGRAAYLLGDDHGALRYFQKEAKKGHALARGWAGLMTVAGRGGDRDEKGGLKAIQAALAEIRKQAEAGDPGAQTLLALLLEDGVGVDKDEKQAAEWFRKAAAKDDVIALVRLGGLYESGRGVKKDEKEAARWFDSAMLHFTLKQGHAAELFDLAERYAAGRGVKKNEKKAAEWFAKAADKGDGETLHRAGRLYEEEGDQLAGNPNLELARKSVTCYKKAVAWYKKAADKGHVWAMLWLGFSHEGGWYVEEDEKKADEWFQKAAAKADVGTLYALGRFDEGREKNAKAARWYEKAAKNGHVGAMVRLGFGYDSGWDDLTNEEKGAEWLQKVADKGDADALCEVARLYEDRTRRLDKRLFSDQEVPKAVAACYKKAVAWYEKAATRGQPEATIHLAMAYEKGAYGLKPDVKQALKWYRKAVALGFGWAKQKIDELESRR